jgi:hypothetical protein
MDGANQTGTGSKQLVQPHHGDLQSIRATAGGGKVDSGLEPVPGQRFWVKQSPAPELGATSKKSVSPGSAFAISQALRCQNFSRAYFAKETVLKFLSFFQRKIYPVTESGVSPETGRPLTVKTAENHSLG